MADSSLSRSVYYDHFGGPESLQVGEIAMAPMGPDSVLVRVAGVGVNPVDYKIAQGYLQGAMEINFPVVIGWDVAGEVLAVGPGITEFAPGDRVFGYARLDTVQHGTAAETVVLPVRVLAHAPTNIDLEHAAAVPLTGLTALQLLRLLDIKPGETVLIHGAAGGVGQFAVQLARLAGATVIGTASVRNHDYLRSLSAEPVGYGTELEESLRRLAPDGVDVVVDLVGAGSLDRSDSIAKADARVGSIADGEGAMARGGAYVFVRPSAVDLEFLAGLIDEGKLIVDVDQTFSFAEAAQAYRLLEERHVRGKIVLTP
jgi:NADPH:quinone reductase-like Zn-dependent oxidoreductase